MTDTEKKNISNIVQVLMQLDKESLFLIDSGARLLAARQGLEVEKNKKEDDE